MKKLICIAIVTLGITTVGFAQKRNYTQNTYQSAIGVRLGSGYYYIFSASFKTFLASSPGALELNLGFRPDSYGGVNVFSVSFAASYQYHFDIFHPAFPLLLMSSPGNCR